MPRIPQPPESYYSDYFDRVCNASRTTALDAAYHAGYSDYCDYGHACTASERASELYPTDEGLREQYLAGWCDSYNDE